MSKLPQSSLFKGDQIVQIQYQCQHISCRNVRCYQGKLKLSPDQFNVLYDSEKDAEILRSPSGYCVLGTPQQFKIFDKQILNPDPKGIALTPRQAYDELNTKLAQAQAELHTLVATFDKQKDALTAKVSTLQARVKKAKALLDAKQASS